MKNTIIRLIGEIDEFKGYWRGQQFVSATRLEKLRVLATIESIGSSTRIEGARLSDSEVGLLLKGIETRSFRSRDEEEVAGYAKAMEMIHESAAEINLTENNIKQLHKVLMQYSSKDQWHFGNYKTHPNHVAAFAPDGHIIGIVFETVPPANTALEMERIVSISREGLDKGEQHPLLVVSNFILRFLAIHPFQDGNGRMSRILTNLLLLRAGYDFICYSSLERVVEANKSAYYLSLRTAQTAQADDVASLEKWTLFFLEMIKKQLEHLKEKLERENIMAGMSPLESEILQLTAEQGEIRLAGIVALTSANRNTVKFHLQKLVKEGRLFAHGKGRGVYYTISG